MSADSMFVLVEIVDSAIACNITRVIRTYWSRERADDDIELLRVASPAAQYRIIDVPHIER